MAFWWIDENEERNYFSLTMTDVGMLEIFFSCYHLRESCLICNWSSKRQVHHYLVNRILYFLCICTILLILYNHITWMIIRNMLTLNSITYTYHRFIQFLIFSRKTQNCSLMRFCCCRWVISYSIKDLRAENAFQCDYTHQCDFRAIFPWK